MTDASVYGGLFRDPTYISTDADATKTDPYDKQDTIPSRYLGKQLLSGGAPPPGQLPDALFSKVYLTLASSEQLDAKMVAQQRAREAREARKAAAQASAHPAVSPKDFRYASFPQQSTGPGSYYGCIQKRPYPYMSESGADAAEDGGDGAATKMTRKQRRRAQRKREAAAAAAAAAARVKLPNIKTNPPKKGTYGVPGLLLSPPLYLASDDTQQDGATRTRSSSRQTRATHGDADGKHGGASSSSSPPQQQKPPFRTQGIAHAFFDEQPYTGVPAIYNAPPTTAGDGAAAASGKQTKAQRRAAAKRAAAEAAAAARLVKHERPFCVPATKSGEQGCLGAFPNVWQQPQDKDDGGGKRKRKHHTKGRDGDSGVAAATATASPRPAGAGEWKPNSFGKSSIVTSCLHRFY